jgi:5'-3' exonuclease
MKILLHLVLILVPISVTSSRPFGRARVAFHHGCSFISNHQIKKITSASNNERWTKAQSTTATTRHDSPLYGIKGFRGWFEATFPSSLVTVDAPKITREYYTTGQKRRKEAPKVVDLNNKTSLPQIYDHVLIDANQYLHSTLRRAYNRNVKKRLRNETIDWEYGLDEDTLELSLVFFVRELEQLVTSIAIPRKSIVIALDGSPGAAKIDMQRQRRFGIYRKAETQRKLISFLIERGWTDSDFGISTSTNIKGIENIIFSKHDREQISLSISPGTEYMDRVTSAILYWSWMSLSKRHWPTESLDDKQPRQVKIYVSPSSVPGEGEVKLIDWMMHGNNSTSKHNKKPLVQMGDSVAFVGGDSDLVL